MVQLNESEWSPAMKSEGEWSPTMKAVIAQLQKNAEKRGFERGFEQSLKQVAMEMLRRGFTIELIADITHLDREKIESLRDRL